MKKIFLAFILVFMIVLTGCDSNPDIERQKEVGSKLEKAQPTPTDVDYSLERYNLIRRTYWVNGQRDKARTLPSPIADMPMGYIVLLTDNGAVVGKFMVEGKVTSLNNWLTPISEYYSSGDSNNEWLADVDGTYGTNPDGIFFFTPDGKYIEWTGIYLYSDIPMEVENPVIIVEGTDN